jgi:hypothetical protein
LKGKRDEISDSGDGGIELYFPDTYCTGWEEHKCLWSAVLSFPVHLHDTRDLVRAYFSRPDSKTTKEKQLTTYFGRSSEMDIVLLILAVPCWIMFVMALGRKEEDSIFPSGLTAISFTVMGILSWMFS